MNKKKKLSDLTAFEQWRLENNKRDIHLTIGEEGMKLLNTLLEREYKFMFGDKQIGSVVNIGDTGLLKRIKASDNIELNKHWILSSLDNQQLSDKGIRKHNNKVKNQFLIS